MDSLNRTSTAFCFSQWRLARQVPWDYGFVIGGFSEMSQDRACCSDAETCFKMPWPSPRREDHSSATCTHSGRAAEAQWRDAACIAQPKKRNFTASPEFGQVHYNSWYDFYSYQELQAMALHTG